MSLGHCQGMFNWGLRPTKALMQPVLPILAVGGVSYLASFNYLTNQNHAEAEGSLISLGTEIHARLRLILIGRWALSSSALSHCVTRSAGCCNFTRPSILSLNIL